MRPARFLPVAAWTLAFGGAAALAQPAPAGETTAGASGAMPPHLPATLPVRRDAAVASAPEGWGAPLALLALTGVGGGWMLWRRTARGRGAAARATRAQQGAVLRLSSQALTPQASVHAVQWNGEEFLLGCTAQQVTLLSRRDAPPNTGEST